jgi:hypothetical protein
MFAAVVGGAMVLIALIALAIPMKIDDAGHSVTCGSGFAGLSAEPGNRDTGHDIGAIMYGDLTSSSDLEGECQRKVDARQAWGWPVGGIGAVVLLGALVIQMSPRTPADAQQPKRTPGTNTP